MKKIFNFFILMVLTNVIFAQEFLTPLSYNPYLMNLKKT